MPVTIRIGSRIEGHIEASTAANMAWSSSFDIGVDKGASGTSL